MVVEMVQMKRKFCSAFFTPPPPKKREREEKKKKGVRKTKAGINGHLSSTCSWLQMLLHTSK
jgi:hypothetical protein